MKPRLVLYQPDIAQNVGSIIRTAVCFGLEVHLIEPMGFPWNEPKMRRAGMDYLERAQVVRHPDWQSFMGGKDSGRLVALTTKGSESLAVFTFKPNDYLLFGRESAGLPDSVHKQTDARVRIPMAKGERSMNLAQSCAIVGFEALRQTGELIEERAGE